MGAMVSLERAIIPWFSLMFRVQKVQPLMIWGKYLNLGSRILHISHPGDQKRTMTRPFMLVQRIGPLVPGATLKSSVRSLITGLLIIDDVGDKFKYGKIDIIFLILYKCLIIILGREVRQKRCHVPGLVRLNQAVVQGAGFIGKSPGPLQVGKRKLPVPVHRVVQLSRGESTGWVFRIGTQ